jgi:ferredoxin-NADP reductase
MLRYICAKKLECDIFVLYGNNRYEDIVFRDELAEMCASHPGLRIEHVLSEPPADWNGRKGMIDKQAVIEAIPDYNNRTFYISGPPRMVMALQEQLAALKIAQDKIIRDSFTGYD